VRFKFIQTHRPARLLQTLLEELADAARVRRGVQEAHGMRPAVGPFARPLSAVPGDRVADRRGRPDRLARVAVQRFRRVVRPTVVRPLLLDARLNALLPSSSRGRQRDAGGRLGLTTNALLTALLHAAR